jgi:hypothetical protein
VLKRFDEDVSCVNIDVGQLDIRLVTRLAVLYKHEAINTVNGGDG